MNQSASTNIAALLRPAPGAAPLAVLMFADPFGAVTGMPDCEPADEGAHYQKIAALLKPEGGVSEST
jgi:hypothetical protein